MPNETGSLVQMDPQLTNIGSGDYHIGSTSPARGTARALSSDLPSDFDGHFYANPASLGAFEVR